MSNNYTGMERFDNDIDAVRNKPSMYVGSTRVLVDGHAPQALTQLAQEIFSNSLDEFVVGYGDEINIEIFEDQSMKIQDFGRGLPKGVGDGFEDAIDAVTGLHVSGKFNSQGYDKLGVAGTHGVGATATNALSEWFEIHAITQKTIKKNNKKVRVEDELVEYYIKFKQNEILEKKIINEYKNVKLVDGTGNTYKKQGSKTPIKTGTTITFLPDDGNISKKSSKKLLGSIVWTNNDLLRRFESGAILNSGLQINFTDYRSTETPEDGPTQYLKRSWKYKDGLSEYLSELTSNDTIIKDVKKPITLSGSSTVKEKGSNVDYEFDFNGAITFIDDISTEMASFANGVPTKQGPHLDGFKNAVTRAFNDYAKINKLSKTLLDASDVLEGMVTTFELRIPGEIAEFAGQTKETLSTAQAKEATYNIVLQKLGDWLYDNPKPAEAMVKKMLDSKAAREAAVKARKDASKAKKSSKNGAKLALASKLKPASSRKPEEKELFITEGDSASNIKRNKKYQAIFPIRGKIVNVFEQKSIAKMLENKEVSTITATIGAGIGPAFELDSMDYHKIIIAADADVDGAHIRLLLMGFFFRAMQPLVEAGRLYSVEAPLYKATKYQNGERDIRMYYSEKEIQADRKNIKGYKIQRYKGLGEMNKDEAYDAITNTETRRLIQITVDDLEDAREKLKILLGKDAELRRKWMDEYIDFDQRREMVN